MTGHVGPDDLVPCRAAKARNRPLFYKNFTLRYRGCRIPAIFRGAVCRFIELFSPALL